MYGFNQCNPFAEPNLVDNTGSLNPQWVQWYQSRTMASLADTVRVGANKMLELQQRMLGFQREFNTNPNSVLASLSAGPMNMMGPDPFFCGHTGQPGEGWRVFFKEMGRYAPFMDEPSIFYPDVVKLEGGVMGDQHPWDGWFMNDSATNLASATTRRGELARQLHEQVRPVHGLPQELMAQPVPFMTPSGHLSLLWVMVQAALNPNKPLQDIHDDGVKLLKPGGYNRHRGWLDPQFGPGGLL